MNNKGPWNYDRIREFLEYSFNKKKLESVDLSVSGSEAEDITFITGTCTALGYKALFDPSSQVVEVKRTGIMVQCPRCKCSFERPAAYYGYQVVQRLYAGGHDEVSVMNLCPKCQVKLDAFMGYHIPIEVEDAPNLSLPVKLTAPPVLNEVFDPFVIVHKGYKGIYARSCPTEEVADSILNNLKNMN